MKTKSIVCATIASCLSACGGGNVETVNSTPSASGPEIATAATATLGVFPTTVEVTYDPDTNTLVITDGTETETLFLNDRYTVAGFDGYYRFVDDLNYAVYVETESGQGFAAAASNNANGFGLLGGIFGRTGPTAVPSAGSGSYEGGYAGWIAPTSDLEAQVFIQGDAFLTADFATGMMSGSIINREDVFDDSNTYADINLSGASISGGAFTGSATGGELNGSLATTSAGQYSGLLAGANAQEVVGSVTINHDQSGTQLIETGAFFGQ